MKKIALLAAGWISLVLGGLGAFLPLLPTTPFVLLAGICFSFSSPRLYRLLQRNRFFGPYIENYKSRKGVPVSVKVQGIVTLWGLLALSAFFMKKRWAVILFAVIGTAVTVHILCMKTRRNEEAEVMTPLVQ
ncbi:MAG: YbaN family protein [Spirochaetaceae bacterium]|jgi:uncharacterized membrane protein YbaN (DUF454 family)|nr:YbaN family protein [Spirochaetaceae bacterium]